MAIEAYRGINVQTPDPTGAAGLRLQTIHKYLADKGFVLEVAADPTANDDAANTGTNGIAREGSLWKNTVTGEYWISGSDATGAA
ncbi:MAG TPA: hypothetical protein VM238_09945, partial [Phycisphaerae bacterium]|nr:hypothetical protein [Phycisphaerae bacterium]